MNDLKLYFIMFAVHGEKQWAAHAGYIFALDEDDIKGLLSERYGDVNVRVVKQIDVKEGTVLYGERWVHI